MSFQQKTLDKVFEQVKGLGFHPIMRDGTLFVSAEHGDDAADYYGEFRGGYPFINQKLEKLAEKFKGYWEWENPGAIGLYQA